ncbi:MAG: virulence protein SciE type [Proteobacteria bacterium]|nr:virulence protein SciE type [Pseudomonadota bacterium]
MIAEQSLREALLNESLAQLQQQVRTDPANAKLRVFLFQLLAVLGRWDRAHTQLNVAAELDPGALAMAQMYREAIRCEVLRGEIFRGLRSPLVFGEPEQWLALLMEALRLTAADRHREARALRDQAFDAAPASSGSIDGQPFAWIADADTRIGPVLEAVVNGRYYWIPFHRIREIRLEEPADLRDVVWSPARFAWANGGESVGLIPTRYPETESQEDDLLRLARKTQWLEPAPELYMGLGQRMLATDAGEHAILDVREILLDVQEPEGGNG